MAPVMCMCARSPPAYGNSATLCVASTNTAGRSPPDADSIHPQVLWGGYCYDPTGIWINLRDGGNFTNHSVEANVGGDWAETVEGEYSTTMKDIKVRHTLVAAGNVAAMELTAWRGCKAVGWGRLSGGSPSPSLPPSLPPPGILAGAHVCSSCRPATKSLMTTAHFVTWR